MKKVISILTSLILATSVFAFEWGGIIGETSYTDDTISNLSFKEYADINMWMRAQFNKNLSLSGDVIYSLDYDFSQSSFASAATQKADLNSLFLRGTYALGDSGWNTGFSVGRIIVADTTSYILSQKLDAAGVSFTSPKSFTLKFYAGYTGLLNSLTNSVYSPYFTAEDTIIYSLAAPYILADFTASFQSLFASQNLTVEALTAIDANFGNSSYNRVYLNLGLDGPIYKSLYYALASSFEGILDSSTGSETPFEFSNLSKAEIMYFFDWNSLVLSANALYVMDNFTSISEQDATIDSMKYTAMFKTGISSSVKFIDVINLSVGLDAVFDSSFAYTGVQYNLSFRYQILDDLQASIYAAQFFYNNAAITDSYLTVKGSVRIAF
ncbi:MAG: hypothetical protein K6G52_05725 [Treponemataceae bacterium]|nr:hypothetical protein [Treponemataceae bacterium]